MKAKDNSSVWTPYHAICREDGTNPLKIVIEDVAHASGDTGILAMVVRADAAACTATSDGDNCALVVDANGRLWANATISALVPGTAATSLGKAQDGAVGATDTGVGMLAKQLAIPANVAGTDGDYEFLQMSAGRLWCSTVLTAGAAVIGHVIVDSGVITTVSTVTTCSTVTSVTGMTGGNTAHDAAAASIKPHLIGAFASAAVPTDVSADGDATQLWCLRSGALVIQPSFGGIPGVAGNGASGTGVQRVTIANDSTGIIALTTSSAVIGSLTSSGGTSGGAGTVATKSELVGASFTAWGSLPAATTLQQVGLQADPAGTLKVASCPLGTPVYATASSGGAAAANATLTIPAAKMGFLDGFDLDGSGATAGSAISVTIVGLLGGTLTYTVGIPAGATVPVRLPFRFNPPLQASAVATNIVINNPSWGSGNLASTTNVYGHYV